MSSASQGGVCFSIHLSGIVNGLTQVIALAGDASAVASAWMSTSVTPKKRPISVPTGLPRSSLRNTRTFTRLFRPVGPSGNVTSAGVTLTCAPITWFSRAATIAFCLAGPLVLRSS